MGQVIGIYPDTMAAYQSWFVFQEVPFCTCSFDHICSVNPDAVENQGQFIDKRNVDIPLCIFYGFRRFSYKMELPEI